MEIQKVLWWLRVRQWAQSLAAASLGVGAQVSLALAIILGVDAAVGLPLDFRNVLRWMVLGGFAFLWLRSLSRRLISHPRLLALEVERGLGLQHDPISNAWSFLQERRPPPSDFWQELMTRQIEDAERLVQENYRQIKNLFSLTRLRQDPGPKALLQLAAFPMMAAGLGLGSGQGPGQALWRILDPYREMASLERRIKLNPPPGSYQKLMGETVAVRLEFSGSRPSYWPAPSIELDEESQEMVPLQSDGSHESYLYTIPALQDKVRIVLRWGEYRAGPWVFEPATPAAMTRLDISVEPPAYAPGPARVLENPTYVSVFEGSRIDVKAQADRALKKLEIFLEKEAEAPLRLFEIKLAGQKSITLGAAPKESGRWRFAVTDQAGLANPQGWIFVLEVLPDGAPHVSILEPTFSEVQMDAKETLKISWEASDDLGLRHVAATLETMAPAAAQSTRNIWKSGPAGALEARGELAFRPEAWGLKSGDQAAFYFEARDKNPRSAQSSKSAPLLIKIQDFRAAHLENIEKTTRQMREELLNHVEKGLEIDSSLTQLSSAAVQQASSDLSQFNEESAKLTERLSSFSSQLGKDPLADPRTSHGVRELSETLTQARLSYLAPARLHLGSGKTAEASRDMRRYLEETQKAAASLDELRKEEKMDQAVSSANQLEELTQELLKNLENSLDAQQLEEILKDIDREFAELARAFANMTPQEFPQEFVNQMPDETEAIRQTADARRQLQEALKRGDSKAALEAARQMLEGLKKLRSDLSEASQAHQKDSQQGLSGTSGSEGQKDSMADQIGQIRKSQEDLLWKTAQIDRAQKMKAPGPMEQELSANDQAQLKEISAKQHELAGQTRGALERLSEIDHAEPSLVLGAKVIRLESAWKNELSAAQALAGLKLENGLESQSTALRLLEDLENELRQMEAQASQPSSGQGSGGRRRSVIMMPSEGSAPGGRQGMHLGEVPIPKREDYKVPTKGREEILRSLGQKRPSQLEREVSEYLRNLLK